ncbi:unnamed protein product [Ceutorhynchus assimilis]|uniref:Uncharacterized protein n=1 Tax=Ceutorhynchus assimilis TaxID=467358 RepID=A0A9N9N1F1_9CUCU|nr:unnamed protein product [Ceutorhynchus assimilis]
MVFLDPKADQRDVTGKAVKILDDLQFVKFCNSTATQSLNKKFELACLPPTSDAAAHHSMRVYLQIQDWLGNSLLATTWGWKKHGECLLPVTADKPVAPEFILKMIYCNDCYKPYSCRKTGLNCSNLCVQCQGTLAAIYSNSM